MAAEVLTVHDPFTGEVVFERPYTRDADAVLDRAVRAQRVWRRCPVEERAAVVSRGLAFFDQNRDEIATAITAEMGKPIVQSRREIDGMLERARHMIAIAPGELRPEVLAELEGVHRRIEHAPLGVVLNLSAWNYPLLITVNVVVPALLAGNTVVVKHSARTPSCGEFFERAFGSLEPADLVSSVLLTHAATADLIADERVAHVAFTGSVEGGHAVYRAASQRFIDAGLELGGKDPAYVAEDADLDGAVPGVVDGACYNAGQSCCAVERVYVHATHYDEFLERAKTELDAYVLGDPRAESTTLGPMASKSALGELARQVEDATVRGARLLCGGRVRDERFFEPTLLADCDQDSLVIREESFGPLVPVIGVRDDDEAIARMNDSRFGLTASVWTRDRERAERFAAEVEAGTIYQNRCDVLDPALPWTGWKDSGKGSTLSRYGFVHLTQRKAVHFKS